MGIDLKVILKMIKDKGKGLWIGWMVEDMKDRWKIIKEVVMGYWNTRDRVNLQDMKVVYLMINLKVMGNYWWRMGKFLKDILTMGFIYVAKLMIKYFYEILFFLFWQWKSEGVIIDDKYCF